MKSMRESMKMMRGMSGGMMGGEMMDKKEEALQVIEWVNLVCFRALAACM